MKSGIFVVDLDEKEIEEELSKHSMNKHVAQ